MRATAVIVLALAAVGCGNDTIDADEAEAGIEQSLSSATASVSSMSCPNDIEKKEGATFTCDAKLEGGGKAKVKVTHTSKGGDFTYIFKPGTVVLTDYAVEPALEEELTASGVPDTTVDCPDTIKVKGRRADRVHSNRRRRATEPADVHLQQCRRNDRRILGQWLGTLSALPGLRITAPFSRMRQSSAGANAAAMALTGVQTGVRAPCITPRSGITKVMAQPGTRRGARTLRAWPSPTR